MSAVIAYNNVRLFIITMIYFFRQDEQDLHDLAFSRQEIILNNPK